MVFTSIGKKVMITTTAALDCQSNPNHITIIGAIPIIGKALIRFPKGRSPFWRNGILSTMIAMINPEKHPIKYPDKTAFKKVCWKSSHNIGIEFEKAIPIFSGEGNSICGIFNPTVNTCHKKSKKMPNKTHLREKLIASAIVMPETEVIEKRDGVSMY